MLSWFNVSNYTSINLFPEQICSRTIPLVLFNDNLRRQLELLILLSSKL